MNVSTHPSQKTRSACNRCHAQKLRCVRPSGQLHCERCRKLKTRCQFAPRAPRGSIKAQRQLSLPVPDLQPNVCANAPLLLPTGVGVDPAMGLDWPVPDGCCDPLASSNDLDLFSQDIQHIDTSIEGSLLWPPDTLPLPDMTGELNLAAVRNPQPSPLGTGVHELANLSIALSELAATLPPASDSRNKSNNAGGEDGLSRTTCNRPDRALVIDELFRLTTGFIDVTTRLFLRQELKDEATSLMVGSCYSRLVETYNIIFSLMQNCIRHSVAPTRTRPGWVIVLPTVQMGSSMVSPAMRVDAESSISSSQSSMYMWMIAVLSSQLWSQLADTMQGQHLGVSSGSTLGGTVWLEMKRRMESLVQKIQNTKKLLRPVRMRMHSV
ncbi:hypothetical protein BDV26DRAFT_266288 [Aspergillus bertholletiae]|uniref:Zn(2)-C6 fungal-type domain-containing protein n=1 Tax=Aspergillus bertholletiae TaxID=1226010 RepID=A0A5N7B250_9EURO|nr:hypothetical protein BDV26DRAFT_266288 [Aspergillus bertholletiae]